MGRMGDNNSTGSIASFEVLGLITRGGA